VINDEIHERIVIENNTLSIIVFCTEKSGTVINTCIPKSTPKIVPIRFKPSHILMFIITSHNIIQNF
jgi:hypothetical protein